MKKQYLTVLFTLICVLGLGLGAQAQEEDTVVAKVSFDFVIGGKVLPATVFDDFQTGHAQLNFEHVGNKYFLSAIETPIGTYAITIPPSAIELARMEQQGTSSSGGN